MNFTVEEVEIIQLALISFAASMRGKASLSELPKSERIRASNHEARAMAIRNKIAKEQL